MPPSTEHVAIVGGGFAGALLAINLMRLQGPRVTLIERHADRLAQGVAYGTAQAEHVLNVRAGNMSAFADDPTHFVRWLEANSLGDATTFVRRRAYGAYLRETLDRCRRESGDRLEIVSDEAIAVEPYGSSYRLRLVSGAQVQPDIVVLALGNLPPHPPAGIGKAVEASGDYIADPWSNDVAAGLDGADTVVLLGTGLTAIDVALSLDANGFVGAIVALSRRGLRPHTHAAVPPQPGLTEKPAHRASWLVRRVRARAAEIGWRGAVDELRPVTQMLWSGANPPTRARFLRHLRPFWDVHRHRLAPSVAARIDALVGAGRLTFVAGKLQESAPVPNGVTLAWRPRGGTTMKSIVARRVVNCTGPQGDLLRSREPLIRQAVADGLIRPDPLRIGVDVDQQSRVIGQSGKADDRLYCIGPMTRGALWEVVAVPDLRRQNWELARRLSHTQWVSGEGL